MKIFMTPLIAFLSIMLLVILFAGCDNKTINPDPKIEVEINDNTDNTSVTVHYKYHYAANGDCHETFDSIEELQAYRKQVDFLLNRLDEAEKKMNTHEPEQ